MAEHKAYHLWHSLADRRAEVELRPFNAKEVSSALYKFSKELGQPINAGLARVLAEQCQGFPWLLKKLCIHVYKLISEGQEQADIVGRSLSVRELFDAEIASLSDAENRCVKMIAEQTPAEFYKVAEVFGYDVLNDLVYKRIVIRSGYRVSLYWDIFKDYVLNGKVPFIPVSYTPQADIAKYVAGINFLHGARETTYHELAEYLGIGLGAVDNFVRDLIAAGHAEALRKEWRIRAAFQDEKDAASRLDRFCRSHVVLIELRNRFHDRHIFDDEDVFAVMKERYRDEKFSDRTLRRYGRVLMRWFVAAKLVEENDGFVVVDRAPLKSLPILTAARFARGVFLGEAPPERAMEALRVFEQGVVDKDELVRRTGRNSVSAIRSLGLVQVGPRGKLFRAGDASGRLEEQLKAAASRTPSVRLISEELRRKESLSGENAGCVLSEKFGPEWSPASRRRYGAAILRWAKWVDGEQVVSRQLSLLSSS